MSYSKKVECFEDLVLLMYDLQEKSISDHSDLFVEKELLFVQYNQKRDRVFIRPHSLVSISDPYTNRGDNKNKVDITVTPLKTKAKNKNNNDNI